MKNISIIKPILEKYHFDDLIIRITTLDTNQHQLMIGILGEFSSGKSTLINAMLGKKLLPALVKPTTARITEIYPVNGQDKQEFYLRDNAGNLRPVSALDFDEALLTAGSEVAIVKTASNELMHEGYCIVDTPGLASLEDTHTDITFGYLPFIDGAIVCQDINKGGLSASLKAFLEKPEVRPFIGRIAFFLTLSDTKSPATITEIRNHYCHELAECLSDMGVPTNGLDERVLAISSKSILDSAASTESIAEIIQSTFVAPRQQIIADRIAIEQRRIADEAISRLHLMRDNLMLDREKYAQRRAEINDELKRLEMDKKRVLRILDEMHPALTEIVRNHLVPLKTILPQQSSNEIGAVLANISTEIQSSVIALIQKRIGGDGTIQLQISGGQLQAALANIDNLVNVGQTIGTAALVAVLASKGVPLHILDSLSEQESDALDATEITEGIIAASVVNMSKGSKLGNIINQINPIALLGNYAGDYFKKSKIDQEINKLIADTSSSIKYQLREYATSQVFEPAENALQAAKQQLDALIAEEKQDDLVLAKRREDVANDILSLLA